MRERWRNAAGWPGYRVSSSGRVRGPRGLLRPTPDKDGYLYVTLRERGRSRRAGVHVLVLEAFVSARPAGMEGCHRNGVHQDNVLVNLRWGTHRENERDKKRESGSETGGPVSRPEISAAPVACGVAR